MASVRARLYARPATRVPLIIGIILSVLAVAGQTLTLTADDDDTFGTGMFVILGVSALVGIVAALRADPYVDPTPTDPRVSKAMNDAVAVGFGIILIGLATQVGLGLVQAIVIGFLEQWDDPFVLLTPLLFGGLVGIGGSLSGLLVGMLIVWPIIKLVDAIGRRLSGRSVVAGVVPLSLLLIAVVTAGIITVLAPHAETSGTPRGRGLALIIGVWFDYTGDTTDQVLSWIARGMQLVIAALVVWLVADTRAAKRSRAE